MAPRALSLLRRMGLEVKALNTCHLTHDVGPMGHADKSVRWPRREGC